MKKILLLLLLLPFISFGQVDLVQWNGSTDLIPTILNNNIVASNATGAGITGPTPSYDGIVGSGWPTGNTIDTGKYFQITLNPILDATLIINEILFNYKGDCNEYQVRYSKTADFSSSTTIVAVTNANPYNNSISGNLTGLNIVVNSGEKIYIRFYAYRGGGNWKLMNNNLLKLRGTITKTPSLLNGSYLISSIDSNAKFLNINDAVSALNNVGVSGPVTFLIDENQTVTSQITINQFSGSSTTNTLTIKPNDGKDVVVSGKIGSGAVIALNGADNVIIDGNNSISDNKLKVYNNFDDSSNASQNRFGIKLYNVAENNKFQNLTVQLNILGVTVGTYSTGIYSGGNNLWENGNNSNNTILNTTFLDVKQAIYVNGSNTSNTNWKIINNRIGSLTDSSKPFLGIYLNNVSTYDISGNLIDGVKRPNGVGGSPMHSAVYLENVSSGKVYNNTIANIQNSTGDSYGYGIYIIGNDNQIFKNSIKNLSSSSSNIGPFGIRAEGNNTTIYKNDMANIFSSHNEGKLTNGIYLSGNNQLVYNNFINDVSSKGGGGINSQNGFGIYVDSGSGVKLYYNTVALKMNQNTGVSAALFINGGSQLDIKNNIFYNAQTSTSYPRYAVYSNVAKSAFTEIDYNDYYATTIGYLGGNQGTFANWKTATGKDVNSINVAPVFISLTDLHLSNGENSKLKAATSISGITVDIDGDTRDITTPYIGADEIKCTFLTKWNGERWFPGDPSIDSKVVFVASYNENEDETKLDENRELIEACSCEVTANFKVVLKKGRTLKVVNEVKVATGAELVFENNASLVQVNEDPNINSGNINYHRHTAKVKRYDYTYWSSPVQGQTMHDLSPKTFYDKYYSYDNRWVVNKYGTLPMIKGEGYIIRAPQDHEINVAKVDETPVFKGIPNNGKVEKVLEKDKSYLLGNPYPSAINADEFLKVNEKVLEGTLYFWTHNSPPSSAILGDKKYNYTTADYATYNRTGGVGTGTAAEKDPKLNYPVGGVTNFSVPTGNIAAGQGFFAPTKAGGTVVFNNKMRISSGSLGTDNSQFFKLSTNSKTTTTSATTEKNRIWLNLTNSEGAFKQTLIGYITGATNEYDGGFDGATYDGNTFVDFYSVNNEKNLTIQGRALPFAKKDSVALGYKSTIKGEFQISIDQADGVLATQNVFLEDKDLKVIHDLKKEAYTFSTEKGAFNNRFVLRYADKNAVEEVIVPEIPGQETNAGVIVSVKDGEIKINATTTKLDKVFVYDMAGRKLFQKNNVDANVFFISRLVWNHQALLVDIVLTDGTKHSKKIIN